MQQNKRPRTNMEMYAILRENAKERQRLIDEHGCCGERDAANWLCKRGGRCWVLVRAVEMLNVREN